jgi:hypothetical protein
MRKEDAELFEIIKIKAREIRELNQEWDREWERPENQYNEREYIAPKIQSKIAQKKWEIFQILEKCI